VSASSPVLTVADVRFGKLTQLLGRFGLSLCLLEDDAPITGSFWGEPEAGIVKRCVYVRLDTPVHSLLHEACHVICMDEVRRAGFECNAGGDDIEEAAVCYLQIVLADYLPGVGRDRLMQDMDTWGYSFRLGSSLVRVRCCRRARLVTRSRAVECLGNADVRAPEIVKR
jgi:hypothetical protein